MGSRNQLRANLGQQEGATSAARALQGGLLGDVACEDLRSGSIIVVISAPRCKPGLPGRVLRPPCFSVCLQPAKAPGEGHGGRPHGSTPVLGSGSNTAVYSFEAWARGCSTCGMDKRKLNTQERALSNQLFTQSSGVNQSVSNLE